MAESIKVFENSLRDYLIDVHSDSYNSAGKIRHRYNNLKVFMEPNKIPIPHFGVSVNISSACYTLEPLAKIAGSMGQDEKFVLMWAMRPNIYGELKRQWAYITKSSEIMKEQVPNEKEAEERMTITKEEIKEAADSVTGFGVRKRQEDDEDRI